MRTQRDEVDAIEAFGTFIWDIRFKDFQAEYNLARITWDEARHTEIGHRALMACGYDPFELKNRLTGSNCRGTMEPAFAIAEINLFGEVGVLNATVGLLCAVISCVLRDLEGIEALGEVDGVGEDEIACGVEAVRGEAGPVGQGEGEVGGGKGVVGCASGAVGPEDDGVSSGE